jgi:hypothetical protein
LLKGGHFGYEVAAGISATPALVPSMRFPIHICIFATVFAAGCSTDVVSPPAAAVPIPPPEGASDAQWNAYWAACKAADDHAQTPYPTWSYPAGWLSQFAKGL